MGTKSWSVKLYLPTEEERAEVADAISRWNRGVRGICRVLLACRRGDLGETGREVWEYVSGSKQAYHVVYGLTGELRLTNRAGKPPSEQTQEKHRLVRRFLEEHGPQRDLLQARKRLGVLWKQAIHAAVERIKSYQEHVQAWQEEHQQWIGEKREWEDGHPHYMELRPLIDAFHREHGVTRGRRIRWHKWLAFLSRPEVAQWLGDGAMVDPLTAEERAEAQRKRRGAARRERDAFFAKNPHLERLDRLHSEYERLYARTHAKRRNPDGFRHRPTFTLPSLPNRPDWPRFQGKEGWRKLDLPARTIDLKLGEGRDGWKTLRFVPDPRLSRLALLPEPQKEGRETYAYRFTNRDGRGVLAQPQGIKLLHKPGGIVLSISIAFQPAACQIDVRQQHITKYAWTWTVKQLRERELTPTTCAVDLAVRHLGGVTIARAGEVTARRILHNRFYLPGTERERAINVPSLAEIAEVRWRLRKMKRRSGRPSPEKRSCRQLQEHYNHLCEDRFKKAVAAIFAYARHHQASLVLFEDLKKLRPDSANERGVNAALQRWNRGRVVAFAQAIAEDAGMRVVTVPAFYTSRICGRCGEPGVRFDQGRKRGDDGPVARDAIRMHHLGHWFYCTGCGRRIHADLNASENLHRVFGGTFPEVKRVDRAQPIYTIANGKAERRIDWRELEATAEATLQAGPTPF